MAVVCGSGRDRLLPARQYGRMPPEDQVVVAIVHCSPDRPTFRRVLPSRLPAQARRGVE